MSGDMVCPHKALPLPSKGSLQVYCVCVSQTVVSWQEPTGCPGWCEHRLRKYEFWDTELIHWALKEVSVSPERRALHCSVAQELVERPSVGWDGTMLLFSDLHPWESGAFPIPISFTLSTSSHGMLSGDTYSGQGGPVGCRQAPQNVHHGVFGDLCRLFKKLPQQCWCSPKLLSVIFVLIP